LGVRHLVQLRQGKTAWPHGPERPYRAVTLMTLVAFFTTVLVRSGDVAQAGWMAQEMSAVVSKMVPRQASVRDFNQAIGFRSVQLRIAAS
jgi:hypothetical protein